MSINKVTRHYSPGEAIDALRTMTVKNPEKASKLNFKEFHNFLEDTFIDRSKNITKEVIADKFEKLALSEQPDKIFSGLKNAQTDKLDFSTVYRIDVNKIGAEQKKNQAQQLHQKRNQ